MGRGGAGRALAREALARSRLRASAALLPPRLTLPPRPPPFAANACSGQGDCLSKDQCICYDVRSALSRGTGRPRSQRGAPR